MAGGTGSESMMQTMPEYLPDLAEPGTLNVPGIAGLAAGMRYIQRQGLDNIFMRESRAAQQCAELLKHYRFRVFSGAHQSGTVSFLPSGDCEAMAEKLARQQIAVRAGLHCAPLAHVSAGTEKTGTVRISFGHDAEKHQIMALAGAFARIKD